MDAIHIDKNIQISNVSKPKCKEKEYTGIKKYGGLLLSLSGSFCTSIIVLCVKLLKDYNFDAYGAAFWRYAGITLPVIPVLIFYECRTRNKKTGDGGSVFDTVWPVFKNDNWKTWIGLLSRGLVGSTSNVLRYYSLQYLSIGDTLVISKSTPVFVTFMAHFLLGEKCGIVPVIIAFKTLGGVIVVSKPPLLTGVETLDSGNLIGAGLALGSVFLSSFSVIITRKLRVVHFALVTLSLGIVGVVETAILSMTLGHHSGIPKGLYDSLLLLGVGGLSFVGTMTMVIALKFEQAGPVTLVRSCDVIFGFVLQFIFLNVVPDIYSLIGTIIVLSGVGVAAWRKYLKTLPDGDESKTKWSWIMK